MKGSILGEEDARTHAANLERADYRVDTIERKEKKRRPAPPVHHLDPAAGGRPQARLLRAEDDADRPAALRGRGARRRGAGRAHHLHADRLDEHGRAGAARDRRHRAGAVRQGIRAGQAPPVQDQAAGAQEAHEAIRPTEALADPRRDRGTAQLGPGAAVSPGLAARGGEPDGGGAVRPGHGGYRGHRGGRASVHRPGHRPDHQVRRLPPGLLRGTRRRARRGRGVTAPRPSRGAGAPAPGGLPGAALHPAAAAVHRGRAGQGAGEQGHRPAVDLCADDLEPARPEIRPPGGEAAPSGGRGVRRHRPPGRALQ